MQRSRTVLSAFAGVVLAAGAMVAVAAVGSTPASASPGLGSNWYGSAPYVMPLDNNPPDLSQVRSATGQKAFELAFILAGGGSCTPAWDGTAPVSSDTQVAGVINTIRSAGGDVSISIGGYNGTKLGQVCSSPAATAGAYQQVIDRYGLHAIDFDLEEPEYENSAAIANEVGAAQLLQRNNPGLYVSITTAGTAAGTGYFGTQLLNQARTDGFTPNSYSIMPFDGGFSGGAGSQISALEAFHSLLMNTFGWDSSTAYSHEGVSMMNGRSDSGEYFHQSDFQSVLDYATSHGLSRYTYWSVNRDRQCSPPDNNGTTSGTCSSVPQGSWEFTTYTTRFAGATPPTGPPPTSPPPTTPPGGCTAPAWNAGTAYTGGTLVSYQGHTWQAKWWTQGDIPGNNGQGVWADQGACSGGPPPPPGSCTAPAWNATAAYTGGTLVTYSSHTWRAKWWTQGDIPGNNGQNVWVDQGPCNG